MSFTLYIIKFDSNEIIKNKNRVENECYWQYGKNTIILSIIVII